MTSLYEVDVDECAIGVFRLDLDGCVIDANRPVVGHARLRMARSEGKSFNDITDPDDGWIGLEALLDLRCRPVRMDFAAAPSAVQKAVFVVLAEADDTRQGQDDDRTRAGQPDRTLQGRQGVGEAPATVKSSQAFLKG